jgi:RimJ/RimL family protein N-acetyltransferase
VAARWKQEEMDTTPQALRHYTARDRLRDGRVLHVRAIRPDDKPALEDGLRRLSDESAYFRFFQQKHDSSPTELTYFTEVDFADQVALVAIVVEEGPLVVGTGRYIICDEIQSTRAAEIAFAVDDTHQGLGIATILLRHLAMIARAAAISEFRASVLSRNRKMLRVLSRSGLPQEHNTADGVLEVRLSLVEPPAAS